MAYTPLNSGELRHIIKIQKQDNERGPDGSIQLAWQDVFTKVYASVEPLSGRELMLNGQVDSEISVRFRIRYRDGVNTKQRVVFKSKVFDIKSVINDNASGIEWITLQCSEGLNDGA